MFLFSSVFIYVVYDGGLRCLVIEIDDSIDIGGYILGGRVLSYVIDKEVESFVFSSYYFYRVFCFGRRGVGVRS